MEDAVVTDAVAAAAAVVEVVVELDVDGSACFFLIVSSSRERIRAIKIYYCQIQLALGFDSYFSPF